MAHLSTELAGKDGKLSQRVIRTFKDNVAHRANSGVDAMLTKALMAWAKKPSKEEENFFASMGVLPSTYDSITRVKCLQVMAVLNRVFGAVGEKSWGIEHSPYPEIPQNEEEQIFAKYITEGLQGWQATGGSDPNEIPDVAINSIKANADAILDDRREFARKRAERMESVVDDILVEGDYNTKIVREYITNLVKFGTGVLIGPCESHVFSHILKYTKGGVKYVPAIKKSLRFCVPNTMDVYPSPGMKDVDDGDLCIRVSYSRAELARVLDFDKKDNWRPEAIKKLFKDHPEHGVEGNNTISMTDGIERIAQLENIHGQSKVFEGIRCFTLVKGDELKELGISVPAFAGGSVNEFSYYDTDVIVIDGRVIYAAVCDPVIGRPVSKSSFYSDSTAQFFGWTLASVIEGCQTLMNVVMAVLKKQLQLKGLVPIVVNGYSEFVDADKPGAFSLSQGKVLLRRASAFTQPGTQQTPIQPVDIPTIIREVTALIEVVWKLCDDLSGFNRNMLGSGNYSGAGRTAQGLDTIMAAASTVAQDVISGMDVMNSRMLKKVTVWINAYFDDESVKGDVNIIPKGQVSRVLKSSRQQQVVAGFNSAMTGVMPQLLGGPNLVRMFGEMLKSIDFPGAASIIPDEERTKFLQDIEDGMRAAEMMQAANVAENPQMDSQPQQQFQGGSSQSPTTVQAQPQQMQKEAGMLPPSEVEQRRNAG